MGDNFQKKLSTGDKLNLHNEQREAFSIRLEMEDGTEVAATLHPGSQLNVTAGTMDMNVYFSDPDPDEGLLEERDQ